MGVRGHGIDLAIISEMRTIVEMPGVNRPGDYFFERTFTATEMATLDTSADFVASVAGRFAAKEAVAKAFGLGWGDNLAWTDIEILKHTSGEPYVKLHGYIAMLAEDCFIRLSISHAGDTAMASVIVCDAA